MRNSTLSTVGYDFEPSKYPGLGYACLRVIISGQPTRRFFDVKALHLPTFDGQFFHQTRVTRHELSPRETFQVCLGRFSLEAYSNDRLQAFSFGGELQTSVLEGSLHCLLTSSAPIFKLKDEMGSAGGTIVEEIMDVLAEKQAGMAGEEDELYSYLAKHDPYQVFLACLVTLQKRVEDYPTKLRGEKYRKVASAIRNAIQVVRQTDGWDGTSPDLDALLSM